MKPDFLSPLLLKDQNQSRIAKKVPLPFQKILPDDLLFSNKNALPNWKLLIEFFTLEGKLTTSGALEIVRRVTEIFQTEKNFNYAEQPLIVVGDLHGQFYDLCYIFQAYGNPDDIKYVFLGDYVDRGMFSVETILLLYSLKINFPNNIFMIRGNHECRSLSQHFNFQNECITKYNSTFHDAIQKSFDNLPLACIINKSILCIHGGISPQLKTLDDLNKINRFVEPPQEGIFCDILWSDPIDNSQGICQPEFKNNTTRSCACFFGFQALSEFLKNNNLISILRGHEVQEEGFKMHTWGQEFPPVITLFSAANYCDVYKNRGAVIKFSNETMDIFQYTGVSHPYMLPNFMDGFTFSIPYIHARVYDMITKILETNISENNQGSMISNEEGSIYHSLIQKLGESPQEKDRRLGADLLQKIKEAVAYEKRMIYMSNGSIVDDKIPRKIAMDKKRDKRSPRESFYHAKKYDAPENERNPYGPSPKYHN